MGPSERFWLSSGFLVSSLRVWDRPGSRSGDSGRVGPAGCCVAPVAEHRRRVRSPSPDASGRSGSCPGWGSGVSAGVALRQWVPPPC